MSKIWAPSSALSSPAIAETDRLAAERAAAVAETEARLRAERRFAPLVPLASPRDAVTERARASLNPTDVRRMPAGLILSHWVHGSQQRVEQLHSAKAEEAYTPVTARIAMREGVQLEEVRGSRQELLARRRAAEEAAQREAQAAQREARVQQQRQEEQLTALRMEELWRKRDHASSNQVNLLQTRLLEKAKREAADAPMSPNT